MKIDESLTPLKVSSMRTTIKVMKRKMSEENVASTSENATPAPGLYQSTMI